MSSNADGRGFFITLEGGEGAGKSTQLDRLAARLRATNLPVMVTREPGGTALAERFRAALLSGILAPFGPAAEAVVFSAARMDHLDSRIGPALDAGTTVVCDRFMDSTRAYQGALGDLEPALLAMLERVVVGSMRPDLTLVLDLPATVGIARANARRGAGAPDRFEREGDTFHRLLRQAFLEIAAAEPDRCVVIDATASPDAVADAAWAAIEDRLLRRGQPA